MVIGSTLGIRDRTGQDRAGKGGGSGRSAHRAAPVENRHPASVGKSVERGGPIRFGIVTRRARVNTFGVGEQAEIGAVAQEILDSLLGLLGFVADVERETKDDMITLQIFSGEAELLIGKGGERLDDIQYLVNRLLHARLGDVGRVRVDAGHYRVMREERFLAQVEELAEKVRYTGKSQSTRPLNAYFRRLVHEAFREDPGIRTESENSRRPLKRVTLRRR